jgi:DNA polymerase III subunit beta
MKFIVNNETLQTELALLSSVAGGKGNSIPVLQNILIESIDDSSLKLTSSDLDVTLYCQAQARVTEPGKVLLPLAKLLAITKTLPKSADLNFESLDNGGANLTFERAAFKLLGPDAEQYPELPEPKASSITIPAHAFRAMIEATIYAITQEESRYALSGARVEINKEGMRMVTTDGHRLALIDSKEVTAAEALELLIPKKALAELSKISNGHEGHFGFSTDENHIYFQVGTRTLISRLVYGQFPNYEMVIPKENNLIVKMSAAAFREAIKRIALMADDRSHAIQLEIKPDQIRITAQSPDEGEAVETIPAEFEGEEITIGFNGAYLLDYYRLFQNGTAIKMELKDANSQVRMQPAEPTEPAPVSIIMPMRI